MTFFLPKKFKISALTVAVLLLLIPMHFGNSQELQTKGEEGIPRHLYNVEIGFLSSPNEEFQWDIINMVKAEIAIAGAATWWSKATGSKISLKIFPNDTPLISSNFNRCNLDKDLAEYLFKKRVKKIEDRKIVILLNSSATCNYAGIAPVRGNTILISKVGLQGKFLDYFRAPEMTDFNRLFERNLKTLIAHELGHSLGLLHSASLSCVNSIENQYFNFSNSSDCLLDNYGDSQDVMGSGNIECDLSSITSPKLQFSLANQSNLGLVKAFNITKLGRYTLLNSQTSKILSSNRSGNILYSINTKYGIIFLELKASFLSSDCDVNRTIESNPGLELRFQGNLLTKNLIPIHKIESDNSPIGLLLLNKVSSRSTIFIRDNSRFFAGETLKIPGTPWYLTILSASNKSATFEIAQTVLKPFPIESKIELTFETVEGELTSYPSRVKWTSTSDNFTYQIYGRSITGFETLINSLSGKQNTYEIADFPWFSEIAVVSVNRRGETLKSGFQKIPRKF